MYRLHTFFIGNVTEKLEEFIAWGSVILLYGVDHFFLAILSAVMTFFPLVTQCLFLEHVHVHNRHSLAKKNQSSLGKKGVCRRRHLSLLIIAPLSCRHIWLFILHDFLYGDDRLMLFWRPCSRVQPNPTPYSDPQGTTHVTETGCALITPHTTMVIIALVR